MAEMQRAGGPRRETSQETSQQTGREARQDARHDGRHDGRHDIRRGAPRESRLTRRVTTTLAVRTRPRGFTEITREVAAFLAEIGAGEGEVSVFCRHTSASLAIQENADPDVRVDLLTALDRLAPEDAGWVHDLEGPDDMPAHVKALITGLHLAVPVIGGRMALGTWQGLYLIEHRARPHERELVVAFTGDGD